MEAVRTARLVVRPFTAADLDDFQAYQSHPDVRRHMTGRAHSPSEAATFLEQQAALEDDVLDAWHDWAVELEGHVIGNVGVFRPADHPHEVDLGFQLDPRHHRRGYGAEAARALVEHLVPAWGLTTVTASCARENLASARLLLALEMTEVSSSGQDDRSFELRR